MRMTLFRLPFFFVLLTVSSWTQELTKRLINQDIIDLTSLGVSEDVILAKIRSVNGKDGVKFDTSIEAIKALKAAKVSDTVIQAMINPLPPIPTPSSAAPSPISARLNLPPSEVGVYWQDGYTFILIEGQAISQAKVGGRAGSLFTYGMRGQHWDASLDGPASNNHIKDRRPVFYFYVPEGSSAADYALIKLEKKGNRREFQIGSFGGITGGKSGVKKDKEVRFKSEHVAIRTYKVTVDNDLASGEYAFFMGTGQQAMMGNGSTSGGSAAGRIYDFNIPD